MKFFSRSRKKITAKIIVISAVLLFLIIPVYFVGAQDVGLNEASNIGLPGPNGRDIKTLLVDIVRYLLSFLGLLAVVVIIYAGWLWMSSGGNQYQLEKAKKTLTNAVIGLVIIVFSFVIVSWIANLILGGVGSGPGGPSGGGPGSGIGLAASGNSTIESHYPARDQREVPRNTRIAITFRDYINVADIIASNGHINTDNVKIYKSNDNNTILHSPNLIASTTDNRTFRFIQEQPYMGSPSENVWYTVELTGDIRKANGEDLFSFGSGYAWQFELSTSIDNTPPKIVSIVPQASSTEPRNVVIQMNFNEAIDPISASGPTTMFNNIRVNSGPLLAGGFFISNQYRTVEFLTNDQCATSSCGTAIYCLPGNADIQVLAKAATLLDPGSGSAAGGNDGIVDMAGNSLDGNSDNIAEGPTAPPLNLPAYNPATPNMATSSDDYTWEFNTTNVIDVTAPTITGINPTYSMTNVLATEVPSANFSKLLMSKSLNKDSISLAANPATNEVSYWITSANEPVGAPTWTQVFLNHRNFITEVSTTYAPVFNSKILDNYQNCFWPSEGLACTPNPAAGSPYCCNGVLSATECAP